MAHKDAKETHTEKTESHETPMMHKARSNPWMISTVVLGVALVALLVFSYGGFASGQTVGADAAAKKVIEFINANPQLGSQVELSKVAREGQLYRVDVKYQGQEVPVYATLDGKYLVSNVVPLSADAQAATGTDTTQTPATQTATSVPKTDKPHVELFVMSYCPYGTQIEKGILPVVDTLKDSIDFDVKFVYYAMHGEKEVKENLQQYCIQKEQEPKYNAYLTCFLKNSDSATCLTEAKIDTKKLNTCIAASDKEFKVTDNFNNQASWLSGQFPLFDINKADNEKYQVAGSPTLIINGVESQSARDSASLLKTICDSFTTAPAACQTQLSSASPSPGFGTATMAASATAANAAQCG